MPDITPDSPVSLLWPDGEGGLTGARAQKRLAAADPPVTTIAELRAKDADDILAIPRSGKGVLAEVRRAMAASGYALALDPQPSPAQQREARQAGQAEAERARKRERVRREDPPPATAGDFTALAADLREELAQAPEEKRRRMLAIPRLDLPVSFSGRPWAWALADPAGAAKLTGYSQASIRAYHAKAKRQHAAGTATKRTMPPDRDGKWVIGDLAVWVATRNEDQAGGIKLTDTDAAVIIAEMNASRGPDGKAAPGVQRELAERYGVHVSLIGKLATGQTVPAEGRQGRDAARQRRRTASLIPETRDAAEAVLERDGQVTFLGLARVLGVDYRTAVGRAAMAGIASALAREQAEDADVAAFLSARLAETRRYLTLGVLTGALHEAGIPASVPQVKRLLPALRAAERRRVHKPAEQGRARGESLHEHGWLYATQVAEDWGVNVGAIIAAIGRGDIKVAERSHGRTWIDPARLRGRTDAIRTPVDKDHPKAVVSEG